MCKPSLQQILLFMHKNATSVKFITNHLIAFQSEDPLFEYVYFNKSFVKIKDHPELCLPDNNCEEFRYQDAEILEFRGEYADYGKFGYFVDLKADNAER